MDEQKIEKILFITLVALSVFAWGMTVFSLQQNAYECCHDNGVEVACIQL